MKRISLALTAVAMLLQIVGPAHAQATRTWVSGVGDDANPCSRTAPCKTFAGAISKTAPSGEIDVLDPGGFGGVTITKSISITNDGVGEAGILVAGTNAVIIAAGANDVVNLRGIVFDGVGTGLNGILFNSGAGLHVQNCVIKNFNGGGSTNGFGIRFTPSAGTSTLNVQDCVISNNGSFGGQTGGGIIIAPSGAANVKSVLKRVAVESNLTGITANGSSTTGRIDLTVSDSVSSGSPFSGIAGVSSLGPTKVMIERTVSVNNTTGVNSVGGQSTTLISGSTVTGNTTGLAFSGGGSLFSYRTNNVNANIVSDGAPSSTFIQE